MKHRFSFLFFLLLTFAHFSQSQDYFSVEQVVALAIQKNYDVRLFQNTATSALNDERYAFGAFIPQVNATGSYIRNISNSRNLPFGGTEKVSRLAGRPHSR